MWAIFLKICLWWLACIGKFLFVPFVMILDDGGEHWSWFGTICITSSGAALGVYIFFHFGEVIFSHFHNWFGSPKRNFKPWKRRVIRLKWKYGIKGLMLISGLISVPVASLIAAKFYRHNHNALPLMIIGFFFWSVVLSSVAYGMKLAGITFSF